METASKAEAVRLPYLDYLRVMAAAAVIMIRVSAQNWDNVPVMSSDWIISTFTAVLPNERFPCS